MLNVKQLKMNKLIKYIWQLNISTLNAIVIEYTVIFEFKKVSTTAFIYI